MRDISSINLPVEDLIAIVPAKFIPELIAEGVGADESVIYLKGREPSIHPMSSADLAELALSRCVPLARPEGTSDVFYNPEAKGVEIVYPSARQPSAIAHTKISWAEDGGICHLAFLAPQNDNPGEARAARPVFHAQKTPVAGNVRVTSDLLKKLGL